MLEAFVDGTLREIAAGAAPTPVALTVLLRVYAVTGRDDLASVLGSALGSAAAVSRDREPAARRAEWLRLYGEAARLTDDRRLHDAAEAIAAGLRETPGSCAEQAAAVQAVLGACSILDAQRFAPAAIDQLERLIVADYEPGDGLRGRTIDEVAAVALALLAAFDVTGRLAYPMLAEELMRGARADLATAPLTTRCAAARVLSRLARLHADDGYRGTAVVAPGADYGADSRALLDAVAACCREPDERAACALALTECGERS